MFFFVLLTPLEPDVMIRSAGAVAQLGARLTGSQEVAGSIPASSTNPTFFEVQDPRSAHITISYSALTARRSYSAISASPACSRSDARC